MFRCVIQHPLYPTGDNSWYKAEKSLHWQWTHSVSLSTRQKPKLLTKDAMLTEWITLSQQFLNRANLFFFPGHAAELSGSQFPQPGTEPRPRQWKPQVLITMPPGNFQGLWDSSHSQSSPRSYICHQNEAVHGLKGLVLGMMKTCQKKPEKKMQKFKNFYRLFLEFIDKIRAELLSTEANLRKNFMLNKNGFLICFL